MSECRRYISKRERAAAAAAALESQAVNPPSRAEVSILGVEHSENTGAKRSKIQSAELPTQQIRVFSGHTKGVNTIKWNKREGTGFHQDQRVELNNVGSLLASASMDGTVIVWDVYNAGTLLWSYDHQGGGFLPACTLIEQWA